MFLKNNSGGSATPPSSKNATAKKETIPSVLTRDMHVLGNIISDGNIDFDGTIDGNIRCAVFTLRANGLLKGEVTADSVFIYGKVKGLIRAKNVQLYATCNVEGIIMHETISIEDGAFIDGKFKRSDKVQTSADTSEEYDFSGSDESEESPRMLENLRLIS